MSDTDHVTSDECSSTGESDAESADEAEMADVGTRPTLCVAGGFKWDVGSAAGEGGVAEPVASSDSEEEENADLEVGVVY